MGAHAREPLRLLVACPTCSRQFDATGREAGARFHCSCGATVDVPEARPQDAAVVRCSSCGAPRRGRSERCVFCDSSFTLHERDLHTICPACMARISDRGRYCHRCGQAILPQEAVGEDSPHACPVCDGSPSMVSRRLGEEEKVAVLECPHCAGLWLGDAIFRLVEERARRSERDAPPRQPSPRAEGQPPQAGPMYRPCPICGQLMHRRNYGRRSGVIIDECGRHGLWFDAGELDRIVAWIRDGHLTSSLELRASEARDEARRREQSPGAAGPIFEPSRALPTAGLLTALIRWLAALR